MSDERKTSVMSNAQTDVLSGGNETVTSAQPAESISQEGKEVSTTPPNTQPINAIENDDPARRRINNAVRGLIKKGMDQIKRILIPPVPSPEELGAMNDEEKLKALSKPVLFPEARQAEGRIINCLTRMNVCYISRKGDKDIVKRVRLDYIRCALDLTYFHIDTDRLPHGVSISQLESQEVINNLSVAVGHKINYRWNEKSGCWYIMERASGTMGIPNHVNLAELWNRIPASKDTLTIPLGLSQNKKIVWESLDDMVHLLIAGTTGGGKSNFLNVVLCTLIRRNKPDRLQLLLVDLKGGLEFNYYEGIPHLLSIPTAPKGIVYERDDVPPLLDWVIFEGQHRMKILLEDKKKNIGEYNAHRQSGRMTHLVVVIDEWADVKLGRGGAEAEIRLANAVQRMRAVGIHVIVCTQVPQSIVLGTLIKANLPAKFAFSCADLQGSMAILNNGRALNLQPKGRCIYRYQSEIEIQTPFIPKSTIEREVQAAIEGTEANDDIKCDVTQEEIREWSLRENNGWLKRDTLYAKFKDRGLSKHVLEGWLKEFDGKEYLIGSTLYQVNPTDFQKPRRLIAKEDGSEEDKSIGP